MLCVNENVSEGKRRAVWPSSKWYILNTKKGMEGLLHDV